MVSKIEALKGLKAFNKWVFNGTFTPSKETYSTPTWDPANVYDNQIGRRQEELEWEFANLRRDHLKKWSTILCVLGFVLFLPFLLFGPLVIVAILMIISPFSLLFILKKMIIDMVKGQIAKQNGWLYDPKDQRPKASLLNTTFRTLPTGTYETVEDQFWGKLNKMNFYTALYTQVIKSGGKNNSTSYYPFTIIAFQLPKKALKNIQIVPENIGNKITNFFSKKDVNVESVQFNDKFIIKYTGKVDKQAAMQMITPVVQTTLLDIAKLKSDVRIEFVGSTMLCFFSGKLLASLKTKAFDTTIHKEDIDQYESQLTTFGDLAAEIAKHIA
ncbi:MAG: hypothetical protein ACI8Y7_000041 [Candidatus Woesearchaeota archaeon]|jgi:hypothetical protein